MEEWSRVSRSPTTTSVASRETTSPSSPSRNWPSPKKDWIDSTRRKSETEAQIFVHNLPQSMTLHKLLNFARKAAGTDFKVVSGRLLRNTITMASLGCGALVCRNQNEARELVARMDGIDAMRGLCLSAVQVINNSKTVRVTGLSEKTAPENLRHFLEQVGPLTSLKNNEIAIFRDPVHALAALNVLDANILDGAVLRLHHHEEPKRILTRNNVITQDGPDIITQDAPPKSQDPTNNWQPSVEIEWSPNTSIEQPLTFLSDQGAEKKEDKEKQKQTEELVSVVRRCVNLHVPDVHTFQKAVPKNELLPYIIEISHVKIRVGLWSDACTLWDTLEEQKMIPSSNYRPGPEQFAIILCLDDSVRDETTLTLAAALRPVDTALVLTRAPLEATAILRCCDGSSVSGPICLQPGHNNRDLVFCIFDTCQAAKKPYTLDNKIHIELVLTLLELARDTEISLSPCEKITQDTKPDEPTFLGASLLRLYESPAEENGSDVTLILAHGARIAAHRSILAARCGFFARHFKNPYAPCTILLNAEYRQVIDTMLCYVYSDIIRGKERERLLRETPKLLLDAAHRFDVKGLAEYVELVLKGRLTERLDNIVHALRPFVPKPPPQNFIQTTNTLTSIEAIANKAALAAASANADLAVYFIKAKPADTDLQKELEATLYNNIENSNLVNLFELAASLDNDKLRDACIAHAKKNLPTVMADPEFSKFLESRSDLVFELLTALDQHQLPSDDDTMTATSNQATPSPKNHQNASSTVLNHGADPKSESFSSSSRRRLSCLAKATV